MTRTRADLESIWRFCTRHRGLLERSEAAGCFHCLSVFAPADIAEWIDEPPAGDGRAHAAPGDTALCPRCGIDAVLPSAALPITRELLAEMAEHYFGGHFEPADCSPPAG